MQVVYEDKELYSVTDMAQLLFGNTSPTSCYASHRLLSQERIFFKQAGRSPPRFQARSEKDVQSLRAKRLAEEQVLSQIKQQLQLSSWWSRTALYEHTSADCIKSVFFGGSEAIPVTCCETV